MRLLLPLALFLSTLSFGQVTLHIENLPANTPAGDALFFAGSLNGWDPGDTNYTLELRNDGDYWIDLPAGSGTVEYKFTRGSWPTVEGNASGGVIPNRSFTYGNGDTLHLTIESWEDLGGSGGGNSTANAQVQVWEAALPIPQLNRSRRVWVYLPQDYATSGKDYRVLYMHDGQNVFDAATSFVGEWEVDESLTQRENEGKESAIVVAIDNGGVHRLDEYSPFVNAQFGGGEGDAYLDFIVHTLKPQIDSAFRTLDGPEHTGIMGSSMGGVISHYAHFRHPDVFGKAGIFSPAYWFSDGFFSHTTATGKVGTPRLYLLAGALETQIANGTAAMFDTLQALGFNAAEAVVSIPSDGEHSEWFWAREFPAAFEWLFPEAPPTGLESPSASAVRLYPNPARNVLYVEAEGPAAVRVFDLLGRPLLAQTIVDRGTIDLQNISGVHQLVVHIRQHNRVQVQRILKL